MFRYAPPDNPIESEAAPDARIYTVGGAVQASQGVYIPRQADADLLALCRAGTFAYVLAPRQVGKSSLMLHTAECLAADGVRTVTLDLTAIGTQVTAEDWYFGLVYEIGDQLGLDADLLGWWESHADMGLPQRFTRFFRDVALRATPGPLVIFVDEIDTTLSLPFTDDFFAAIRAFYDARARVPAFRRLSWVLIGVATPGDLIHDPRRTPFNIGQRVEMTDFNLEEAAPLAAGLGLPPATAQAVLGWALGWTGGHPYLTQRLCQALTQAGQEIWSADAVAALVHRLFLGEQSSQDNNVQFVRDMLTKRAPDLTAVLTTYRAVWLGRRPVLDEEQSLIKSHLKLSGVVRREGAVLQVRNPIYRTVFDDHWVREHLPVSIDWVLWLRRALIALIALFVLAVTVLGLYAEARRGDAEAARMLAEARELAIRATTAGDPEVGLLLAIEAAKHLQNGHVDDVNGQIAQVLSDALRNSHVRQRLTHPGPVLAAAWSPDGQRLLTGDEDGLARVWDAIGGQLLLTLRGHTGAINAVAWSPDGKRLVTAGADKTARLWDAASGQAGRVLQGHTDAVLGVAWSPDGRWIVTAGRDSTARVWDAASGATVAVLTGHSSWVRSAAWSPDGRFIVTASADSTARIWVAPPAMGSGTGAKDAAPLVLRGHIRDIHSAAYSPDGRFVVTASEDGTARMWNVASGQQVRLLQGPGAALTGATYSPDGRLIATSAADGMVQLWDAATGQATLPLLGHAGVVNGVAWSPDGQRLATAGADSTARLWSIAGGQARVILPAPSGAAYSAAYSPDGRSLVSAGQDGKARVWAVPGAPSPISPQPLAVLGSGKAGLRDAAFSPDGRRVVTAGEDNTAQVWDLPTGQALHTLSGHTGAVNGAGWSPDGRWIVTAGADTTAQIWDATSGQARQVLQGHSSAVHSAVYSPDGRFIVTASADDTARIWDATSGQVVGTLRGHTDAVNSAVYSPDGRFIATASDDKTAQIWDAATGQALRTLRGHTDAVAGVAYSPDGRLLVTAGADGTARVWDAATGQERLTLQGHASAVHRAAWSPDGRWIVTAGADGTVRIYAATLDDLLALALTRATRALTADERAQLGLLAPPPTATRAPVLSQQAPPLVTPTQAAPTGSPPTPTQAAPVLSQQTPASTPTGSPPLPAPLGHIAFASNRGAPLQSQLYVLDATGHERALTSAPVYNLYPDWSPDGTQLVYVEADPQIPSDSPAGDLWLLSTGGSPPRRLTQGLNAKWPRWSPDGQHIVYADAPVNRSTDYDLYLLSLSDPNLEHHRLMDVPGFDGYPAWTPDGAIIFASDRINDKNRNNHLYRMQADGSDQEQLTFGPGKQESPAVSPDGSRIAFVSTQDGAERIYIMDRDGSGIRQVTFGPGVDRYPTWSPDGRWIAFHSNRDDQRNFEIYRVPAAGGAVQRLTTDAGADDEPAWGP